MAQATGNLCVCGMPHLYYGLPDRPRVLGFAPLDYVHSLIVNRLQNCSKHDMLVSEINCEGKS